MPSLALKQAPHSRRDATHTQSCCVSASTNTPVEAAHTMYGTRALTRKRVSTLTLKFVSLFLCGFVLGMVMSRSTSRTETASQRGIEMLWKTQLSRLWQRHHITSALHYTCIHPHIAAAYMQYMNMYMNLQVAVVNYYVRSNAHRLTAWRMDSP